MKIADLVLSSLLLFANQASAGSDADDEMEFASNGCAMASLAFSFLSDEMGRDLEAMSTTEAREAFLKEIAGMDKGKYTRVLRATLLLSYSAALKTTREQMEVVKTAIANTTPDEAGLRRAKELPWRSGADTLMAECMFRAGKLAGQGRLLSTSK